MNAPHVLVSGVVLGQPLGGVLRHNAELLPRAGAELARRGGHLAVLEGVPAIGFELGERVQLIPSDVPMRPIWKRWQRERKALKHVVRQAEREGRPFHLWHTAHLPVPNVGLPYALTIHDLRDLGRDARGTLRGILAPWVLKRAIEGARVVITVSESVRAEIMERFRVRRVALVPNAGDHFAPEPRRPAARPFLLHVGHVEPRKNIELLLEVLALDGGLPDLKLAGAHKGDEGMRLRRIAVRLGVERRVHWLGTVPDAELPGLYAEANCVVLPSHLEGFGIPVLEAQLARVPLAIASTDALREVAGDEVPRFSPDAPRQALAAIHQAIGMDEEALSRSERLAQRYRWRTSSERLLDAWCGVEVR